MLPKTSKHGHARVLIEVMCLTLGKFVGEYTIRVIDVLVISQSDTGISVEAVDPMFQTKTSEMLRETGILTWLLAGIQSLRLGCWHCAADINTQQNSDTFPNTAVALAVTPTQGVETDCYKCLHTDLFQYDGALEHERRQLQVGSMKQTICPGINSVIKQMSLPYYTINYQPK